MKGSLLVAPALLLSAACAPPPGNQYLVLIDRGSGFSDEQLAQIVEAANWWTSKVPELELDTRIGHCGGIHGGEICIHLGTVPTHGPHQLGYTEYRLGPGSRGDTGGLFGTDGGETWLYESVIDAAGAEFRDAWTSTAAHEMGHAMGLLHQPGPVLMNPDIRGAADRVTCADVVQWEWVRGLPTPFCSEAP